MSMFCFQCQENAGNQGCRFNKGVCGKPAETANLMDVLIYSLKGLSIVALKAQEQGKLETNPGLFIAQSLFTTITNANFDEHRIVSLIKKTLKLRDELKIRIQLPEEHHDSVSWKGNSYEDFQEKAKTVGVLSTENEDVRSLRELLIYGCKGISAYYDHAAMLGFEDDTITQFLMEGLESTTKELSTEEMINWVMKAGETAVKTMALLDKANTSTYGNPEITKVNIGVRNNPGILISGHDLKDMEELLKQTEGTGVDVYTHSEMLPANYYPAFKKFAHFVGNYGSSWWHQNQDFESFNGPILMTTNCIIPVKDTYKDRIFTTGMTGYPGVKHIPDREAGKAKDFSEIIELAKKCEPPI
ncbi:MAG: hydroxylamine reductase, partial [Candidatus Cloacimonetes bacterium]|nr:hydroxylamine reductase [Candidatus Cloacimonadota bacterium]